MSKRIFNSVDEINENLGVKVNISDNIPEGCNIVCYNIEDLYNLRCYGFYKEIDGKLNYYINKGWEDFGFSTLEEEVKYDKEFGYDNLIYLRLPEKDVFKPERLLGVETNVGFIVDVFGGGWMESSTTLCFGFQTTKGYCFSNRSNLVKYYISDDSDDTVSFDEYVRMFYGD